MCTAISYKNKDAYFGRNLDLERGYGECVTIAPRKYVFRMRHMEPMPSHYAMIGMATVVDEFPLYYEATNEKGLSMAGLNFPGNAVYYDYDDKKDNDDADDKKEEEDDAKKKFELLEAEHAELQSKYAALEASYQELVEFKKQIEDKEKDDLIASFYMLSDEDKAEVIANKANYSLKEIKAELSMICVDKKVNFNLNDEEKELEKPLTYNLSQSETVSKPAWLKAVEDTQKRLNN